uniref:Uncharacterized protein n=1 Tax=viral metagenome TaxID=1070528 RepID=A0A6M3IYM7_9ZZZZ
MDTRDLVKTTRTNIGYSKKRFASILGVSENAVHRWELPSENKDHRTPEGSAIQLIRNLRVQLKMEVD